MNKIALFYAPEKGSTDRVAHKFAEIAGKERFDLTLVDENTKAEQLDAYKHIIFAVSTVGRDSWSSDYNKVGWDFFITKLESYDLTLARVAVQQGADLVGKCSTDDYEFSDSDAVEGDMFLGLPIDEDNDDDLTEERLTNWWESIRSDFE